MRKKEAYLVFDIGTGNYRVALTDSAGNILRLERNSMNYVSDTLYPDSVYFDANELWQHLIALTRKVLQDAGDISIAGITASSQREGIVLIDDKGNSLIGLPNHDHRGREWEQHAANPDLIYERTGRYPGSLFSALKLVGLRERRPDLYGKVSCMLSISDWVQFMFTDIAAYEHSQASETLLYNVKEQKWDYDLCEIYELDKNLLPPLVQSDTVLGKVREQYRNLPGINNTTVVVVGGADTQLAIESTKPEQGDIVLVSGTTTPVALIMDGYAIDSAQRTWTNRHTVAGSFILEANAGVTGLNYQRLKDIFYPNEGYDVIEKELGQSSSNHCSASLGSLIAGEDGPLTRGGFLFNTPVSHELNRASFVKAALWDIACSIYENFKILTEVKSYEKEFIWACGGGFQSSLLRQYLAALTGKKIYMRNGYQQASVSGATLACNRALGLTMEQENELNVFQADSGDFKAMYQEWKQTRAAFGELIRKKQNVS